jgi:hypothetical protein
MNKNNSQTPQLPQTAVKCRFFAQYYGQEILRWHQWVVTTPDSKVDLSIPAVEKSGWFIKLKPLSKITKEHIEKFAFLIFNSYFEIKDIYQNASDTWVIIINEKYYLVQYKDCNQRQIDFLRSEGYAVPFDEYSVEDLISFGWAQLV